MIYSVDKYLNRIYDRNHYSCANFLVEAWRGLVGDDLGDVMQGILFPMKNRTVTLRLMKAFGRIEKPESPCIVLMQKRRNPPHLGMFIRGKILHIREEGVQFVPIDVAVFGFDSVRFYQCKP